jgi:ribosomal protein S18 acetylase RimI-like enzyme
MALKLERTTSVVRRVDAGDEDQLGRIRALFREYASSIERPGCFQDFETELMALPRIYAPPGGLWLALDGSGETVGCVGLRLLDGKRGELKRLYLRPAGRGQGLGRALLEEALRAAQAGGLTQVLLDSLPEMQAAQALYRAAGFVPVPPYASHPPGAECFGLSLEPMARPGGG